MSLPYYKSMEGQKRIDFFNNKLKGFENNIAETFKKCSKNTLTNVINFISVLKLQAQK